MKNLFLLLLFSSCCATLNAQVRVSVFYDDPQSLGGFEQLLLASRDMTYRKVSVIPAKEDYYTISVYCTECRNGEFSEKYVTGTGMKTDGVTFRFLSEPIGDTTVRVGFQREGDWAAYPYSSFHAEYLPYLGVARQKFIETFPEEYQEIACEGPIFFISSAERIPILAFTGAKTEERFHNGHPYVHEDFSVLLNTRIHPSKWYDELGVDNYIFYSVEFETTDIEIVEDMEEE